MERKTVDRGAKNPIGHLRKLDIASAALLLGSFLSRYRLEVLQISQERMAERLSARLEAAGRTRGVSETTYRKLESGDPTVNFTYWLTVFQEFGNLEEVIRAAEPATEAFHAIVSAIPGFEEVKL